MRKSAICRMVGSGTAAFSNNSGVANLAIVAIIATLAAVDISSQSITTYYAFWAIICCRAVAS